MLFCAWYSFLITSSSLLLNLADNKRNGAFRITSIVMTTPIILFFVKYIFGV